MKFVGQKRPLSYLVLSFRVKVFQVSGLRECICQIKIYTLLIHNEFEKITIKFFERLLFQKFLILSPGQEKNIHKNFFYHV